MSDTTTIPGYADRPKLAETRLAAETRRTTPAGVQAQRKRATAANCSRARRSAYWDRPIDVFATRPIIRNAAFEQLTDRATAGSRAE